MKKRVLAALLALVMLFGALPMSVFAEDLETVEEPSGTFEPDEPEKYTYHLYYDFNYVWDWQHQVEHRVWTHSGHQLHVHG